MSIKNNKGFETATVEAYKAQIKAGGNNYILDKEDEQTDEYVHFYFVGQYEDREVIYDSVIYTLRLHHESELYEVAEDRASKQFPDYKKFTQERSDEIGKGADNVDPREEEIGMYLAEIILELEDDEAIKVQEHVDQDIDAEFGISLDVGLHVESITPNVIAKFVRDFNEDTITLDENLYSFQTQEGDEE